MIMSESMCLRRRSVRVTPSGSSILTSSRNSVQIFGLRVKRCLKCCLILSGLSNKTFIIDILLKIIFFRGPLCISLSWNSRELTSDTFLRNTELLSRSLSLQVTDFFLSLPFTSFVINIYKNDLEILVRAGAGVSPGLWLLLWFLQLLKTENNSLTKWLKAVSLQPRAQAGSR